MITALAASTVAALAAPAWGQGDDTTLRRDGSKAVPFVADVSTQGASSSGPALRRDGSKAVPFVADVGLEAAVPTGTAAAADAFDWADAAIGLGIGLTAGLLVAAIPSGARRRRLHVGRAQAPAARV